MVQGMISCLRFALVDIIRIFLYLQLSYFLCFGGTFVLISALSQDYMPHGSQGLFTQVGFNDPSQEDASQSHFGVANANSLQSQVFF